MSAWLSRQRKPDLFGLATQAGVPNTDGMRKDELVSALNDHLLANTILLSGNPVFKEFYNRTESPMKRGRKGSEPLAPIEYEPRSTRGRRRRTTQVKEEFDSMDDSAVENNYQSPYATRTPRTVQTLAEQVPLPPSPAVVADHIDRGTTILREKIETYWAESGITEGAESMREMLSSVVGIEASVLLLELIALQREVMPWQYYFDIPAVPFIGTRSYPVKLPNLFLLLNSAFWYPTLLWALTSVLVPLFFAYWFNLTITSSKKPRVTYQADPLTFNVMKALVTWLVYSQGVRLSGWINDQTVARVDGAIYGGYRGILIGAAMGALGSIYEAVLRR